eukprot:8151532-Alexandrium_andersonii.AAC.1
MVVAHPGATDGAWNGVGALKVSVDTLAVRRSVGSLVLAEGQRRTVLALEESPRADHSRSWPV